jgi:hypothetical protein
VNPPTWVDEHGRPRAKRPCPRCGREIPVLSVPTEQLGVYGWHRGSSGAPWRGAASVEGIPVPDLDGRWRFIVVEGEAS